MSQKKKAPVRAHKVKSRGVWIAPDLERTIKGEGGRRGLTEPPYSYYLHLADLVLKPTLPAGSSGTSVSKDLKPVDREQLFNPSPLQPIALPPAPVLPVTSRAHPKLMLPRPQPPKPPKLAAPKPPRRPSQPKLSLPKPPKRKR